MTKFFKALGLSALYFLIYFLLQIVFIFIFAFIGTILSSARGGQLSPETMIFSIDDYLSYILAISIIAALSIYLVIYRSRNRSLIKEVSLKGLDFKTLGYLLLVSFTASLLSGLLVSALIPYFPSYNEVSESITSTSSNTLGVMVTTLMVPFFEEVLFRGLIYREFKKIMPFIPALIIQGIIFGAAHGNMLQFIYAFLLGLILGSVYHWTKSLWAPIVVHCAFNLLGSVVLPNYLSVNDMLIYIYLLGGTLVTVFCLYKLWYLGTCKDRAVLDESTNVENSI